MISIGSSPPVLLDQTPQPFRPGKALLGAPLSITRSKSLIDARVAGTRGAKYLPEPECPGGKAEWRPGRPLQDYLSVDDALAPNGPTEDPWLTFHLKRVPNEGVSPHSHDANMSWEFPCIASTCGPLMARKSLSAWPASWISRWRWPACDQLAWHGHHTEAGCPGDRSADTPETRDIGLALALSDSREALEPPSRVPRPQGPSVRIIGLGPAQF